MSKFKRNFKTWDHRVRKTVILALTIPLLTVMPQGPSAFAATAQAGDGFCSQTFTGGTDVSVVHDGSSCVVIFKATSANATNSYTWTVPVNATTVSVLVVGGGGSGGVRHAAGGGAGGYIYTTGISLTPNGSVSISAGAGGAAVSGATNSNGNSGTASSFASYSAAGGGFGGQANAGGPGGSGGGGCCSNAAGAGNTPALTPSQGNNGGVGTRGASEWNWSGGGGGGAGSVGGNSTSTSSIGGVADYTTTGTVTGGAGGSGVANSITGTSVCYAAGGGGGVAASGANGGAGGKCGATTSGGAGGKGPNGTSPNYLPLQGVDATGSGGGGGGFEAGTNAASGRGGSGVVVVRYDLPTVTFSANNGTGVASATSLAVNSSNQVMLPTKNTLARTGYVFAGWNTASNGLGTNYAEGATFTPSSTTTLYAQWNSKIQYNGNTATTSRAIESTTAVSGESSTTLSKGNLVRGTPVSTGLILNLDASDPSTISGSTWINKAAGVSGADASATIIGSPTYNSADGYFALNGSSQYIQLSSSNYYFNSTKNYTLSICFNSSDTNKSSALIARYNGNVAGTYLFYQYGDTLYANREVNPWGATGVSKIASGENYCAVESFDGSYVRLYINGVLDATSALISGSVYDSTINTTIGAAYDNSAATRFLKGKIYNAQIYNRALSLSEVQSNYQTMAPGQLATKTNYTLAPWNSAADGTGSNYGSTATDLNALPTPYMRLQPANYTQATKTWVNTVGSANFTYRGTPTYSASNNGKFGATGNFPVLGGTTSDGINLVNPVLPSYTLCVVARYRGLAATPATPATQGRIVAGTTENWISGFYGGKTSLFHHINGFNYNPTGSDLNWHYYCDGGNRAFWDGTQTPWTNQATTYLPALSINGGWSSAEYSDWELADLIIYDQTLTNAQIEQVNRFFKNNYGITSGATSVAAAVTTSPSTTYASTGDTTLYANWGSAITYDGNKQSTGTAPSPTLITGASGALASNSGLLTKAGWRFDGWNTNESGTGTNYPAGGTINNSGNITLYAKWTLVTTFPSSLSYQNPNSLAPYMRFVASDYDATNKIWKDSSGNGRNTSYVRGAPSLQTTTANQNGVTKSFTTLQGGTSDGIQFKNPTMDSGKWTIFSLARYNGVQSGLSRIFDGEAGNFLFGFYNSAAGVAHYNGWITSTSDVFAKNWLISTGYTDYYRASGINGSNVFTTVNATANATDTLQQLTINAGQLVGSETSNWQVAEVIIYDRQLTLSEITKVEDYLAATYGITSYPSVGTYATSSTLSIAATIGGRSDTFTATNGLGTKTFSISPTVSGITLDTSTANGVAVVVNGLVPVGTYVETLTATDQAGATSTFLVNINVATPIKWSASNTTTLTTSYGKAASLRLDITGGLTGKIATLTKPNSPPLPGVTIDTSTLSSSGYITLNVGSSVLPGTYTLTVTATDDTKKSSTQSITVTVNNLPLINYAPGTSDTTTTVIKSGLWLQYEIGTSWSGTGTTVVDLTGNNTSGSVTSGAPYSASAGGGSVTLNGTNKVGINTGSILAADSLSKFYWIYPTAATGTIVKTCNSDCGYIESELELIDGKLYARLWNLNSFSTQETITLNTWHYVGYIYDASGTTSIYIDGRLSASAANSGTRGPPAAPQFDWISQGGVTNLGTTSGGQFSFGGAHYYKRVLSASEVFSNYAATAPRYLGTTFPGLSLSGTASITTTQGVASSYPVFTASNGTGNKVLAVTPTTAGITVDTSTANTAILSIANTVAATNATTARVYLETITATDSVSAIANYTLQITVNPPISITPTIASTVTTTFGVTAYDTFTAAYGTGTLTFSSTASSNQSAFVLTKPSANVGLLTIANNLPVGTYTDTITVTDSVSAVTNYVLTIVVNPRIAITGATSTTLSTTIGKAASLRINVTNGSGARTLSYTSPIAGITIDSSTIASNYATLNVATSTPANTFTLAVTATDALGVSATETFTVTVNKAPKITGPSIVSTGLELNFDAGNAASYSGTGTTWNSTVGGKSVTLLGTSGLPTYSSNSGGLIDFNATDLTTQKHYAAGSIANTAFGSYTVETWAKFAYIPTAEINGLVSDKYTTKINYELFYGSITGSTDLNCKDAVGIHIGHYDGSNWHCSKAVTGIATNTWYHIVAVYDATVGFKIYINGVLQAGATAASTGNATADAANREIYIAKRHDTTSQFFPGSIPVVRIYSRALTAAEALQNYSAIGYRFVSAGSGSDSVTVTAGKALSVATVITTDGTGDKTFAVSGLNSGITVSSPAASQFNLNLASSLTSVDSVTARTLYETVTATDSVSATTAFSYKITVNPPIQQSVTSNSISITSGINAYDTFTATYGTGNKTFALTGSPSTAGFTLTQSNNVAVLKVESTVNPGTYYETVTATDTLGATQAYGITVVVTPPPTILGISRIDSTKGVTLKSSLFALSGGTGILSLTLTNSPSNSNITLTGVTSTGGYLQVGSASETGTYLSTIRVTDATGSYSELVVTVVVNAPVTLSGALSITKTYGTSSTSGYSTNGSGTAPFTFSGKTICATVKSVSGGYTYEKIDGTDSCVWTAPVGVSTIDALLVGAGGGGGPDGGSGGGGGSINTLTAVTVPGNRQLAVQVGAGGTGGIFSGNAATNGGTTSLVSGATTYTAPGGSAGGGCGSASAAGGVTGSGGSATAGGSGGYGATGTSCAAGTGAVGSNGPASSFTGSSVTYGGGGGGGPFPDAITPVGLKAGGAGGGGTGTQASGQSSYGLPTYFRTLSGTPSNATVKESFSTGTCGTLTGNIGYSTDSEFPCSQKDNFQGFATGYFIAPFTGDITFYLTSDDSSDLVINVNGVNKELQLADCCKTVSTTWSGFTAGQAYPINVYFTEIGGGALWKLDYSYNGGAQTTIPLSQLRSGSYGLATYFRAGNGTTAFSKNSFTSGTCAQIVGNIDFANDAAFPCDGKDSFQGYANGYFIAPYTGDIKFYLTSDDTSVLSININGTNNEIQNPCCATTSATWSGFVQGQYYPISAYFTENTGVALWRLEYEYTGQTKTVIPITYLRSNADFVAPTAGTNGLGGGGGGGSAGLYKITGAKGGSGTTVIKYLTPSDTATSTMITAYVNQQTPTGLLTLNVPEFVNVGVYTETITVQDAANSAPYSAVVTITINKATPTVAVSLPGAVVTAKYGTPVLVSAVSATAGKVVFKDGASTISGCESVTAVSGIATCNWTPPAIGSRTITAKLSPTDSANYNNSADATLTVTVGKADTLTVTATNETLTYTGATSLVTKRFTTSGLVSIDTLTAVSMIYSGTANDGTSYSSSTAPTLAGTYVITPDTTTVGVSTISSNYLGVTPVPGTLTLNRAANTSSLIYPTVNTNSAVTSPPANNYITYKPNLTDTPTVKSRNGNGLISFSSLTASSCSVDSATGIMSIIQAGNCQINMTVAQGSNYLADSTTATIQIAKGNRTIALTSATSTLKYFDTATVVTTISNGASDGAITYSLNATPGCTFDSLGGILTATSGTLACTLNASIAEGTNYLIASTATALPLTIAKANAPSITIDSVTAVDYALGQRVTVAPTYRITGFKGTDAASVLTLTYNFVSNPFETFSYSDTRTPIDAGTYSIVPSAMVMSSGLVTNYETPNYPASAASVTVNRIAQASVTIQNVNGEITVPFTLVASGGNNPTGALTFTMVSGAGCSVSGNQLTASAAGTCKVRVTMAGNRNYLPVTSDTVTVQVRNYQLIPVFTFGNSGSGVTLSSVTPVTKGQDRCASTCVPILTLSTPYQGVAGDVIILTGTNFTGATRVIFNIFTDATIFSVDLDTQITVQVPTGLTPGDGTIEVETPGGVSARYFDFTVLP